MATDITPYLQHTEMIRATAQQVIKDFGVSGMDIQFSGKPESAYTELYAQILPWIEKLLKENNRSFFNLMYRIDLSEGQIKKEIGMAVNKSFAEIITDLILKRELLKVIIRKQASAGKQL